MQESFIKVADIHAPLKVKSVRGNQKPHLTRTVRKAIIKRSRLELKANLTGNLTDIRNNK